MSDENSSSGDWRRNALGFQSRVRSRVYWTDVGRQGRLVREEKFYERRKPKVSWGPKGGVTGREESETTTKE